MENAEVLVESNEPASLDSKREQERLIARNRLAIFYKRLADSVTDEMSYGVLYAMHKEATEILKRLRP